MKEAQLFETTKYYCDCPQCGEYLELDTITEFVWCDCGEKFRVNPPKE